jgi:regulatory protein YycH of two-component signal transduction system YycFG
MDREIIKTWVLTGLVFLSMFLTYKLWFEIPSPGNVAVHPPGEGDYPPKIQLVGALSPDRIVVHFRPDKHTVLNSSQELYSQTWLYVQNLFKNITAAKRSELIEVEENQWFRAVRSSSIEIIFNFGFSMNFWAQILNDNTQWEGVDIKPIRVLISPKAKSMLFKDAEDRIYALRLDNGVIKKVEQLILNVERLDLPIYVTFAPQTQFDILIQPGIYVPAEQPRIPEVLLKGDRVEPSEFAALFFENMSIVRKIEEKDGALIYTDGQKGLRLYSDGTVEYSSAITGDEFVEQNLVRAFKLSGKFLKQHNGWAKEICLTDIKKEETPDGYNYKFVYSLKFNGLKIKGKQDPIQVTVSQNEVKNYFHIMKWPVKGFKEYYEELYTPAEAFETVLGNLEMFIGLKEETTLKDVYLAYYFNESNEKLKPIWVFEFGELEVLVDATTCNVVAASG